MALAQPQLIGIETNFRDRADGLEIQYTQDIRQDFLDANKRERAYNAQHRAQELHRVASIPTSVIEVWMRQGFDIYEQPTSAIVKRLRSESLDDFLTSDKV